MPWSGFPLQPDAPWNSSFAINQVIDAMNERGRNIPRVNPGDNVQSASFWLNLQFNAFPDARVVNPDFIPSQGDTRINNGYRFNPIGQAGSAFDYAGLTLDGVQGFIRRTPDGLGGYTESRGGFPRHGDYLGPWLLNDMYHLLNAQHVFLADQNIENQIRYEKDVQTENNSYSDTRGVYDSAPFEETTQFDFESRIQQGFGTFNGIQSSRFIRSRHYQFDTSINPNLLLSRSIDLNEFERSRIMQFIFGSRGGIGEYNPAGTPLQGQPELSLALIEDRIVERDNLGDVFSSFGGESFPYEFGEDTPFQSFRGNFLTFCDLSVPGGLSFVTPE